MADRTRFSIPKHYEDTLVTLFPKEAHKMSIPVAGIAGLASYGFVSLLDAQLVGGPKTVDYINETAANLSVYLSNGWKPGDSAGIMRRKFQLTRALAKFVGKRDRKTVSFASILPQVQAMDDPHRQAAWNSGPIQNIVAEWNQTGERKSAVDVNALFKGVKG